MDRFLRDVPRPRIHAMMRKLGISSAMVALAVAFSGCAGLADVRFTQDHRLTFAEPAAGAVVELPVVIQWDMADFEITDEDSSGNDGDGYFAVVVDRYPMGPGRPLSDLLPAGSCTSDPECPSPDVLASLADTYVTHETSVTIPSLARTEYGTDSHYAVVILIDPEGNRVGDSSWTVNFTIEREGGAS